MIWASPPCTEYSRALTRRPRRLEEGDRTAIRTLELIRDLRLRFWCIENPQTGLLKRRCDLFASMASLTRRRLGCGTTCLGSPSTASAAQVRAARCPEPMEGGILRLRSGARSAAGARSCKTAKGRGSFTASPTKVLCREIARLVLGFLGSSPRPLPAAFLQTPHSTAVSLP